MRRLPLPTTCALAVVAFALPASALAADLSVTVADSPDPAQLGRELRYEVVVANAGPDTATDVGVRVSLSKDVDPVKASGDAVRCVARRTTTCDVGGVAPGAVAVIEVLVRPTAPGTITSVVIAQTSAPDADAADNSATAVTDVDLVPGACANLRLGTPVGDLLPGTRGGDAIFGRAGDDTLRGAAGDDCLSGGRGEDTLRGAGGDDVLFGDAGADDLSGGGGADWVEAGPGPDRIVEAGSVDAGPGNDLIVAPPGALVHCGPGRDVVRRLGGARLFDCERAVSAPPPTVCRGCGGGGGGGGGGVGGGGGGGFRPGAPTTRGGGGEPRRRKRCRRRYCPHGGIPARVFPTP